MLLLGVVARGESETHFSHWLFCVPTAAKADFLTDAIHLSQRA